MKLTHAVRALIVCALAFSLAACQPKVEEQTAFKNLVDRQDRADKDVDAIRRQLSVIDRDLQQVTVDVGETLKKAGPGGNPQAVAAIEQRLQKIEATLGASAQGLTAVNARLDKIEAGGAREAVNVAAAPKASPAAKPATADAKPANTAAAPAAKAAAKASLVVNKKPASSEARAARPASHGGVYHQVTPGETVGAIAKSYRVSESTLRQANAIPAGRNVMPGQQLYVPVVAR